MSKHIFVSLPVRDLNKSIAFYTSLGAAKNPQFSDDTAACMVISDSFFVMLLTHAKWKTFTNKPIVDAHRESEVMLGLTADSRAAVDAAAQAVAANGGKVDANPAQDLGFMYSRSFEDVDGHTVEVAYMDMSQLQKNA